MRDHQSLVACPAVEHSQAPPKQVAFKQFVDSIMIEVRSTENSNLIEWLRPCDRVGVGAIYIERIDLRAATRRKCVVGCVRESPLSQATHKVFAVYPFDSFCRAIDHFESES